VGVLLIVHHRPRRQTTATTAHANYAWVSLGSRVSIDFL
jgi:hypothetical protein